jgi:hypothetical protein
MDAPCNFGFAMHDPNELGPVISSHNVHVWNVLSPALLGIIMGITFGIGGVSNAHGALRVIAPLVGVVFVAAGVAGMKTLRRMYGDRWEIRPEGLACIGPNEARAWRWVDLTCNVTRDMHGKIVRVTLKGIRGPLTRERIDRFVALAKDIEVRCGRPGWA